MFADVRRHFLLAAPSTFSSPVIIMALSLTTPRAVFSAFLLDTYGIEGNEMPIDQGHPDWISR